MDLVSSSWGTSTNHVLLMYSITETRAPVSRTTVLTASSAPSSRLIQPRVVILMTFSRDPAEGGDLDDLLEEAAQQDYAEADHDYDDDERKHLHYAFRESGRHTLQPAREHGREPACQEYTENEAHDASELPHQSVLDALEYCQCEQYENDDIYDCHDMRR